MNTLESVTIGDYYQLQPKQQGALLLRPRGTLGRRTRNWSLTAPRVLATLRVHLN